MSRDQFAADLLQSAQEALAISEGRMMPAKTYNRMDVAAIRQRQGLTQQEFSQTYGIALSTIRGWEQGRRLPDASARLLLRVIDRDPDLVAQVARDIDAAHGETGKDVAAQ